MRAAVEAIQGDITRLQVDAIVNAANAALLGGGGVDGAIHRAAGPELLADCRVLGGCDPGEARITRGHRLPARWVIHTVGPVWRGGDEGEPDVLAACYINSLGLAAARSLRSVAFPAISCGAYGYPPQSAARIAVASTLAFLRHDTILERVIFCCFTGETLRAHQDALAAAHAVAKPG